MIISKISGVEWVYKLGERILKIPYVGRFAQAVFRFFYSIFGFVFESHLHLRLLLRKESGVSSDDSAPRIIVSFTSIPERLNHIPLCVERLFSQSLKPHKIILWLSEEMEGAALPGSLERLTRFGLTIRYCEDVGPHTKIHYALKEYPDSIIVTCDDDIIYPKDWLKILYREYRENPSFIHCYRAHQITLEEDGRIKPYSQWEISSPGILGPSLTLFPTGVGGVLYPPGSLDEEVLDKDRFMKICPYADDIWLKAMSLKKGTLCKKVYRNYDRNYETLHSQKRALCAENVRENRNDAYVAAVFEGMKIK